MKPKLELGPGGGGVYKVCLVCMPTPGMRKEMLEVVWQTF